MIAKIKRTKIKRTKILLQRRVCDVMEMEEFRIEFCVHGYHIYEDIWYAVVGKVLVSEKEPIDFHAVAVRKKNSARLIFTHKVTRKNILTAKITPTTVYITCTWFHTRNITC